MSVGLGVWFFFYICVHTCIHTGASEVFRFKGTCDSVGLAGSLASKLSAERLCGKRWAQGDLQHHQLSWK